MRKINYTIIIIPIIILIFIAGCVTPHNYVLKRTPTKKTISFRNIEVSKVTWDETKDEIQPETPLNLRKLIIREIQKKEFFAKVATSIETTERTMRINCKILTLDKGSKLARFAIGSGSGKAHMDVECKFIDKKADKVFASGVFTGDIKDGLLGGEPNQTAMALEVAKGIATFLEKGK